MFFALLHLFSPLLILNANFPQPYLAPIAGWGCLDDLTDENRLHEDARRVCNTELVADGGKLWIRVSIYTAYGCNVRCVQHQLQYIPEPSANLGFFQDSTARDPRPLIVHEGVHMTLMRFRNFLGCIFHNAREYARLVPYV